MENDIPEPWLYVVVAPGKELDVRNASPSESMAWKTAMDDIFGYTSVVHMNVSSRLKAVSFMKNSGYILCKCSVTPLPSSL